VYFKQQFINVDNIVSKELTSLSSSDIKSSDAKGLDDVGNEKKSQEENLKHENDLKLEAEESKKQQITNLKLKCEGLIENIRFLKHQGVVIETSPEAQIKITELQNNLRQLIPMIYGPEPYIVEMKLTFPQSMPDYVTNGANGKITFELAPLSLVPYSVYYFLDIISNWNVSL
jgi:hypothetical protein